jgi:hypothetical protein
MILKDILTKEQEEAGLTLHCDEDFVYLYYGERVLATWSTQGASQVMIRVKAQELLDRIIKLGVVAEREKSQTQNV